MIGHYQNGSGLTTVLTTLAEQLAHHYQVGVLGLSKQDEVTPKSLIQSYTLHLQTLRTTVFTVERKWLQEHMRAECPEIIVVMGPAYLTRQLLHQLQPFRSKAKIVLYLSVEGELIDKKVLSIFPLMDHCIVYSKFTLKNIEDLYLQGQTPFVKPEFSVVGHGLDLHDFFPVPSGQIAIPELRKTYFPHSPELHQAFIILNANRNYYRKRLDLTILGFSIFAQDKPDAFLYLHTGEMSKEQEEKLQELIFNSGVADRILVNPLTPKGEKLSKAKLNILYNMCDVGLTTAMGEGWGLTAFEHAASGAAQVMPFHSTFMENWKESALFIPVTHTEFVFYEYANMYVVSAQDVANALSPLYLNRVYRMKMAKAAIAKANDKKLDWKNIGDRFKNALQRTKQKINYPQISTGLIELPAQ